MHIKAEHTYTAGDKQEARVVLRSISPEIQSWPRRTTSVTADIDGRTVCVYIDAPTISEARAAVNTLCSWLGVASSVYGELVEFR